MTERPPRPLGAWLRSRPRAGWILSAAAAVAGAVAGWQISWLSSLPGLSALGGFALAALIGAAVVLAAGAGLVLLLLHRSRPGQVLLMPAVACTLATILGVIAGPSYRPQAAFAGDLSLEISAPSVVRIEGRATCDTPENSDTVRHITAVSAGYVLGERTTITLSLPAAEGGGTPDVVLTRGQELVETPARRPQYGILAGSSVQFEAGADNREGRLVFVGLGPLDPGVPWGSSDEQPQRLDGEVRWACEPEPLQASVEPRANGTISLSGAVEASLGVDGACGEEFPILRFETEFSGGKGSESPSSGDDISGVLSLLGPGVWELIVFRRSTDESAEAVGADRADFARQTDADGAVIGDRLDADFSLSYGSVHVLAEWRC